MRGKLYWNWRRICIAWEELIHKILGERLFMAYLDRKLKKLNIPDEIIEVSMGDCYEKVMERIEKMEQEEKPKSEDE